MTEATISVRAGKKINLGNYETYEISLSEEITLREDDEDFTRCERNRVFRRLKEEIETWEAVIKAEKGREIKGMRIRT